MKLLWGLVPLLCVAPALGRPPGPEEFGSTRNSRVAFPMPADDSAPRSSLTILMGQLPPKEIAAFEKVAPNVRIVSGLTRQSALEHAGEANAVAAHLLTPDFLKNAPNLVWVISFSAGVDRYVKIEGIDNDRIVLTNSRAVHGPAIADHAFAMLLTLSRDLPTYAAHQKQGKWQDRADDPDFRPFALQGKTMLVVGLGGIGSEIARRADGFGMRVVATRRSDSESPAFVQRVGKPQDLAEMLPEADIVAVCVPLTSETQGLFNAAMFARMKRGAILINIARGKIVDTDALLQALQSGALAGACLDVTDPEPLPPSHPLWKQPRVIITPHVAADADLTDEREWLLIRENIRRFGAGEPLLNVVDVKSGY